MDRRFCLGLFLTFAAFAAPPNELTADERKAGWKLLGFDDRAIWQAPFGFYDASPGEEA